MRNSARRIVENRVWREIRRAESDVNRMRRGILHAELVTDILWQGILHAEWDIDKC